jgi:hypothetical protein
VTIRLPGALAAGSIILFRNGGGRPVLHRIIGVQKLRGTGIVLTTKGDASRYCDTPVAADQVIAVIVGIEKTRAAGQIVTIDLESPRRRAINWLLALLHRLTCFGAGRFRGGPLELHGHRADKPDRRGTDGYARGVIGQLSDHGWRILQKISRLIL